MKKTNKPAWASKPNFIEIRKGNKAETGSYISGIAHIIDSDRSGYCSIRFGRELEKIIGKKLPYGVGPENQIYLLAINKYIGWEVWAVYVDNSKSTLLWRQDSKPNWVGKLRNIYNETSQIKEKNNKARSARDSR